MIKVNYHVVDGDVIDFSVLGHADYKKSNGIDLVCACVSSIVIGGLNAIKDDKNYLMHVESGDVVVKVQKPNNDDNIVIKTIITQLKTLETKYSNNIVIKEL
ncbi:MAG: ribosomal-processing cysteine protease Prp [Bacilli bacterium]|jgi:uncharacterized protein YsxB (DUF464 family)